MTLIRVLSKRLFNLVSDHTFPTAPATGVSSIATSFIKTAATSAGVGSALSGERNPTNEVLNCLRVLQRVLPVIFESDFADLERHALWELEEVREEVGESGPGRDVGIRDERPQFVIEDDEEDDGPITPRLPKSPRGTSSPSRASCLTRSPSVKAKTLPPLAERLISCAIDLLFCCGFTLPSKIQVDHYKINYVIWYATGVQFTAHQLC